MTDNILANKYRATSFAQLIGQHQAIAGLAHTIKQGKVPNVILISANSGFGKTTLARIIAYKINNVKYNEPLPDFYEANLGIDRGIEDMKEAIDLAKFMPQKSYRVILLDEIAKATSQAVSALLKPLEDIPPNTVWILATDQPKKLPATLLRRCYHIKLQEVPDNLMLEHLRSIIKKEKGRLHSSVYRTIIAQAQGSLGFALPLLQFALTASDAGVNRKKLCQQLQQKFSSADTPISIDIACTILAAIFNNKAEIVNQTCRQAKVEAITLLNAMQYANAAYYTKVVENQAYLPKHLQGLNTIKLKSVRQICLVAEQINHYLEFFNNVAPPEMPTLLLALGKITNDLQNLKL